MDLSKFTKVDDAYDLITNLPYMDLEDFINQLADQPLLFQPGTKWHYSWSYDVLGYIVQVASGQPLDEYMRDKIFGPLLMDDTDFYVPIDRIGRFAVQYMVNPTSNQLVPLIRPRMDVFQAYRVPGLVLGGAGLVSTANDYSRFAQMLLNGGELDGVRTLQPESVDMMWRNHLTQDLLPFELNG